MQVGITSGCIITTQFTMPGKQTKQNGKAAGAFGDYLDYMTRNEAVQKYSAENKLVNDYSGYLDYMSNEYKTITANNGKAVEDMDTEDYKVIFTSDKDNLTKDEYKKVKEAFNLAEQNGSPLWETVISFDMKWIEQFHLYDSESKYVDDKKIREITRKCVRTILEAEGMTESAIWTGDIHYNTDNLHIHIGTVEPVPTRRKVVKDGKEEYRGKWKMSSINKGRSAVVNSIMDNSKSNELINNVIRKDIIEEKKQHPINQDPELCSLFFDIYEKLKPIDKLQWKYSNNVLKSVRPLINELSRQYINKYHSEDYKKLIEMLQEQEQKYSLAYGNGEKTKNQYAKNKIEDLYKRLGNAILKEVSKYDKEQKDTSSEKKEKKIKHYPRDILNNKATTGGNTIKAIHGINRTINGLKEAMKSTKDHAINQYLYEMMQRALEEGKSVDEAMQIPNSYINRDR